MHGLMITFKPVKQNCNLIISGVARVWQGMAFATPT